MNAVHFGLLALAGVGGGLTGSVAGIASFVSYPALLATGLAPLAANVTNTVALVGSGVGTTLGSTPELRDQWGLVRRLAVASALGGIVGGALLLLTPGAVFARIVPWLIGGAALAVLARPRPHAREADTDGRSARLQVGVFLTGIYGGYFGAAAGVVLLALLLLLTGEPLHRASAVRTVVLGAANLVAAIGFVLFGPVAWASVLPLALGFLVGGRLGPVILRHAPQGPLRVVIALAGLAMAVKLGLDAY